MISGSDITRGFSGVLAMARGVDDWADRYDLSVTGVFRSFWAVPLSIPAMALVFECVRRNAINMPDKPLLFELAPWAFAVEKTILSLVAWALMLGVLLGLGRSFSIGWRIGPLIMGHNWSMLLVNIVLALTVGASTLLGAAGTAQVMILIVFGFSMWIDWGLLRRPLGLPPLLTLALMVTFQGVWFLLDGVFDMLVAAIWGPLGDVPVTISYED